MNLNFYQPENGNYLQNLQAALQDQMNKLDQLKSITVNANQPKVNQPLQPQRYYLDCGLKEDWDEFLNINYGINEDQIFEDYRLFLQAKAELHQDTDKAKLEAMKDKLRPQQRGNINVQDSRVISNEHAIRYDKQTVATDNENMQREGDNNVR